MTLSDFLKKTDTSPANFAKSLGVDTATVYRWAGGQRFPAPEFLSKIAKATNGKVTANDFVEAA